MSTYLTFVPDHRIDTKQLRCGHEYLRRTRYPTYPDLQGPFVVKYKLGQVNRASDSTNAIVRERTSVLLAASRPCEGGTIALRTKPSLRA